ncbi:MAG: hypothetical protein JXO51_04010 [Candidatus Aminicenantes bacterium]|nr:hypothetical protein [Candidatus Aminicenantes bacterium]
MKKLILEQLLADKPPDTRQKVGQAFGPVSGNFEFAASVSMEITQQRMDEASDRGFVVWCNKDARSAIMYGAGNVHQEVFSDCMNWLKGIGIKGEIVMVHFEGQEGDKLINIQN